MELIKYITSHINHDFLKLVIVISFRRYFLYSFRSIFFFKLQIVFLCIQLNEFNVEEQQENRIEIILFFSLCVKKTPPLYDPRKIRVPVAIFRGGRDWLADTTDVEWLLPQLNVTHDIYVPFYEHLDMTYGFDAVTRMYKYIVEILMGK